MLTDSQKTALKADILANTDQQVIDGLTNGDNGAIAAWYNEFASPAYFVWRPNVPASVIADIIELDDVANITDTDGARLVRFFDIRSNNGGNFHGDRFSDREAFADVFSAAAGDQSETAIAKSWYRQATNAEKLFSLGTQPGTEPSAKDVAVDAGPDELTFQGAITFQDVGAALNS